MSQQKLKAVNEWLTLLTNAGVLAGLIALVLEIGQNTVALQNETDVAVYSMAADNSARILEVPELRRAIQLAEANDPALAADDRLVLGVYWGNEVDRVELQFRLYKRNNSNLDNIVFYEPHLLLPAFQQWWASAKPMYEPEFVTYLDALVSKTR